MRKLTPFPFLAGALLMAGCSTYGVKVEHAELTRFQPGVTPCAEIVQALQPRQPTRDSQRSNHTRQLTYVYGHSDADAGAIALAVLGIPAGRTQTEQTTVTIDCDTAGLLTEYATTKGQMGVGVGVTGGQKQ